MSTINQNTTPLLNGMSWDINEVENAQGGVGVSQPTYFEYNVIPMAINATLIAPAQTVTAGVPLNLTAVNQTTFLGQQVIRFDCLRVPSITLAGANTANATNLTFVGYDDRNVAVTGTVTIPINTPAGTYSLRNPAGVAGGVAGSTGGFKTYKKIVSVTSSAALAGTTLSVGNGDAFGLPFFVPQAAYIKNIIWNNAALSPLTATIFYPGYQFNPVIYAPLTQNPFSFNPLNTTNTGLGSIANPSATSTDARGYVVVPNASNGTYPPTTPFGATKMLTVCFYVYGADSYLQWKLVNETQYDINNNTNASSFPLPGSSAIAQTQILAPNPTLYTPGVNVIGLGSYNAGQMLDQDEVGLQFPGGF